MFKTSLFTILSEQSAFIFKVHKENGFPFKHSQLYISEHKSGG